MKRIDVNKKTIIFSAIFLVLIIFVGFVSYLYIDWSNNYKDKIYPGIKIGNISLSGLTSQEAEKLINEESGRIYQQGLNLSYNNQNVNLPSVTSANTDLSFSIFTFDTEETLENIERISPKGSFLSYLNNTLFHAFQEKDMPMAYSLDEERVKAYLSENFKNHLAEAVNASFVGKNAGLGNISFSIIPERVGKQLDFELALENIRKQLSSLDNNGTISLKTITARPDVTASQLESLRPQAEQIISRGELILKTNLSEYPSFTIKKDVLASWIRSEGVQEYKIGLDDEKIAKYLQEKVSPKTDQEAQLSRYEIKDGKMTNWQSGSNGRKLNIDASINNIKEQYLINGSNSLDLVIDTVTPDINASEDNINIQEIIGTGHSNFAGSPANRRHNISVGAKAVHGILIPPGEEFSLVKTLGEIDAKSGYLPELVIKNNKTIPEYGGGLCQVGTTMFRSALASGLPVTARQNHSYRVSYYEPAGTDAAIYDPWPDMKFLNDTGNYVLIQSRIEGNDIYFDFWGKRDGRTASSSKPVIYNIVKPAPTKIVETTDLKPGEKKCTEKPHNGADAYFDYAVTYPDGNVKNVRFKSHYVPWQEVCLIGKVATSSPASISTTTTPVN